MMTSELSQLAAVAPWLTAPGPENDVIISSRVRLSRNLADHRFPGQMDEEEAQSVAEFVADVVRHELTPEPFDVDAFDLRPSALSDREVGFLLERGSVDRPLPRRLFLSANEGAAVHVGGTDHVRIVSNAGGLQLVKALTTVQSMDCVLENYLNYAVSLDWGYLSTDIMNLGTAMRASFLAHIPAIAATGRLEPLRASLSKSGFKLVTPQPLSSEGDGSNLVVLRNLRTLGLDENALVAKLEEYAAKLVHYERVAREELLSGRGAEIADAAHRALGILRFARSLSATETRSLVSDLRLGAVAGVVNEVAAQTTTTLFLIIHDNHVCALRRRAGQPVNGEEEIDVARAAVVRQALAGS